MKSASDAGLCFGGGGGGGGLPAPTAPTAPTAAGVVGAAGTEDLVDLRLGAPVSVREKCLTDVATGWQIDHKRAVMLQLDRSFESSKGG